jgi:hypothetical protein
VRGAKGLNPKIDTRMHMYTYSYIEVKAGMYHVYDPILTNFFNLSTNYETDL